jgi:glycosyltransferase involved in cell wall biosynthesis
MRIFVQSKHRYPARKAGPGGGRVFDVLVKGLAELGHDVSYCLDQGAGEEAFPGVRLISKPSWDADIYHIRSDSQLAQTMTQRRLPWVATCHVDLQIHGKSRNLSNPNWVYVSKALASTYGSDRFVYNGVDPAELCFSEAKSDYFLFVSALPLAMHKGLPQALAIAERTGIELRVAGSAEDPQLIQQISDFCDRPGVRYLGEIQGSEKAEQFAGARALLFPTQLNEAFGLVLVEAMMSGTPVICSANGACAEIVSPKVGFVCHNDDDYLAAVDNLDQISALDCRSTAIQEFHYLRMAENYIAEYEIELAGQKKPQSVPLTIINGG